MIPLMRNSISLLFCYVPRDSKVRWFKFWFCYSLAEYSGTNYELFHFTYLCV